MKRIFAFAITVALIVTLSSCGLAPVEDMINDLMPNEEKDTAQQLVPWGVEKLTVATDHISVERDDYYRYNEFSPKEREVYSALYNAVSSGVSILDLSNYNIPTGSIGNLFFNFCSDNPQFFYLNRSCHFRFDMESDTVTSILLCYSDGTVTDTFNEYNMLISQADRNVIAEKSRELESRIDEVLSMIPVDASTVEKERLIHDYLVENVIYEDTLQDKYSEGDTVPHEYDVYGALCLGRAVCEGYSKAFQLLCYYVGINAVQIEGAGDGGDHMWNAVYLDDWYHVDVTWDDSIPNDGVPYYQYFNVADHKILVDHQIDQTKLSAPECNGEVYSYYNQYAAIVTTLDCEPENYMRVADAIAAGKQRYVIIYSNGLTLSSEYLIENFLNENSVFLEYAEYMGYNIQLSWEYYVYGDYYYISA